jgi:hypothetical protein
MSSSGHRRHISQANLLLDFHGHQLCKLRITLILLSRKSVYFDTLQFRYRPGSQMDCQDMEDPMSVAAKGIARELDRLIDCLIHGRSSIPESIISVEVVVIEGTWFYGPLHFNKTAARQDLIDTMLLPMKRLDEMMTHSSY